MTVLVTDRQSYAITHREFTDEGYLKVPGRVARTGIQQYLASELGLTDRKPDEIVNVYRPPEEVFAPDALSSYADADITNGHPDDMVTADSFKRVSLGHATDAGRAEDDYVVVDLLIKDKDGIKAVEEGRVNLSAGYNAEYHQEPGTTADGTDYEYVQRGIRINHIALVDRARAGQGARLYDHQRGAAMSTVTLDGQTVEVQDQATAKLIQQAFDMSKKEQEDMGKKAKEHEDEAKKLREEMESEKAEKDAAIEERDKAKAAASDEAIAERINAVQGVRDTAVKMAGEEFTCDSVDPMQIRRAALAQIRDSIDWADKSDAYVQAAWDIEVAKTEDERAADKAKHSHDAFAGDLKHLYTGDGQPVGDSAYSNFLNGKASEVH